MEAIKSQVSALAQSLDATARTQLRNSLRDLMYSLESPEDTMGRLQYVHLQTSAARIGFKLGLFKLLTKSDSDLSVSELAQATGTDVMLLGRILRYLGSNGSITEVSKDLYKPNHVTHNLAQSFVEAGVSFNPQYQHLPQFLEQDGYRNPSDPLHTAFQGAFNTDLSSYAWFEKYPEHLRLFNNFMATRQHPAKSWMSAYPVEEETQNWQGQAPAFVDIGGGVGNYCTAFKEKFPAVKGRVVLQDIPSALGQAPESLPGVEKMTYNLVDSQPIKGAKFYFLRGILHDHTDEKCNLFLRNTVSAMDADSRLIVDEVVLPETGVSEPVAALDLTMLTAHAAMERTESQLRAMLEAAGLQVKQVSVYDHRTREAVIEAVKAH